MSTTPGGSSGERASVMLEISRSSIPNRLLTKIMKGNMVKSR